MWMKGRTISCQSKHNQGLDGLNGANLSTLCVLRNLLQKLESAGSTQMKAIVTIAISGQCPINALPSPCRTR